MKTRLFTGIGILIVYALAFFLRQVWTVFAFDAFVFLVTAVAVCEISKAVYSKYQEKYVFYFSAAYVILLFVPFFLIDNFFVVYLLIFCAASILAMVFDMKKSLEGLALLITIYIYPTLFLSTMADLNHTQFGFEMLLTVFVASIFTDVLAYVVGVTLGKNRRKLIPSVSPKKSVLGAVGGFIGGIVGGVLVWLLLVKVFNGTGLEFVHFAIIGLLGGVTTQLGDLMASAIKRKLDIKDFGSFLPGHGGVIDRFDGIMLTATAALIYAQFILPLLR